MATAFAVFCSEDGSLNFYKRDAVPAVGDTFEGKVVDNIYLNVEQKYYSKIAELSWYADGTYQNITSVNCVDEISPEVLWGWFHQCSNLTYVNLRKLDTKNTTNMKMTFDGCSSLQSLDLSNFNTVSVINMQQMFRNCSNLATIYVSELWSTDNLTDRNSLFMFDGCTALSGDIPYVGTYTDKTYATYTGGYFTYKKYYPLEICGDFIIQGETLYDLANNIRVLCGTDETMTPAKMQSNLDIVAEKMDSALFLESETKTATMPSSAKWRAVAYGNGKFIAIDQTSNGKLLAYSTDGIVWNQSTFPATSMSPWSFATYGNGKFIACITNGNMAAYSTDGITWTQANLPFYGYDWTPITCNNEIFVAVRPATTANQNQAAYSADGITWTTTTLPASAHWRGVAYGGGKFVAIGCTISNYQITAANYAAYSADGITWVATTMPSSAKWKTVIYGGGKFVATADGSTAAAYSADGITWVATTMPSSANWKSIAYDNEKFVAVAENSTAAAYSTDGITWVNVTLPSSAAWAGVTYGDGKFITTSYNSNLAIYSIDGINWYDSVTDTFIVDNSNTDVTEETVQATELLDKELVTQDDVIAQIMTALEGKTTGREKLEAQVVELESQVDNLEAQVAELNESWAGTLTFSGTYATSTYYTAAGCSIAVDKQKGMAFIIIQGGTSTSYENIYFNATSLPSGVTLLTPPGDTNFGTGGSTKRYYTAVLTGITGKINVAVAMGTRAGTSYDAVRCDLTVTYV